MKQGYEQQVSFSEAVDHNKQDPVECLGITFANDEERRAYFLEILSKKLKDPEFRKIEGFPIGEDEDILALSDPPYYTACPNPFIENFIKHYGRPYDPNEPYSREPFAADVSEGKNDPIYNAHSYHTKVPHKAIMRYILHYTEPGDVVFDGFCGTGMTGVAAQLCDDKSVVESLGYRVEKDGQILQQEKDDNGKVVWVSFSKIGARRTVLNDLSPAATFIAYNYNSPVDVEAFEQEASRILKEVDDECGWMYETLHVDGKSKGRINYTVWSDIFVCPECTSEIIFWDVAIDKEARKVKDDYRCKECGNILSKRQMDRSWISVYDAALKKTIRQAKQKPVLINYSYQKKRFEKLPDEYDLELISKIDAIEITHWFPIERMMEGEETRRNDPMGLTHVHHYFTKRNLWVLSTFYSKCSIKHRLLFQSIVATLCSRLVRFNMGKRGNGPLSGTLYVSSLNAEADVVKVAAGKVNDFKKALNSRAPNYVQSQSFEAMVIEAQTIDYIFIDPPFGSNLNYSELNYLWESWLKVWTNNKPEAIENKSQNKGINEYRQLMTLCFKEAYRILKPGRWMTVEFSNTKASVWNSIQTALAEAGFIVANVSALNKKQGSFKAVTTPTAVKQDLVISAYKPDGAFEERFTKKAVTEEGVWEFIRTHLKFLPIYKKGAVKKLVNITERDPRILSKPV
jgi:DNA modification methylase/predicted RNA-binding Zn-ribbon protein involved in translation (DUF1610 family)